MAKDPAILFYTSDFIAGTLTMTDGQRGKYIILLCLQHQKGRLSEKDMLNICKTYDEEIFEKFTKNSDGKFYNKRMEDEVLKRKAYSESRRINRMSKKGKKKKVKKISKTYVPHMEDEDININISKKENEFIEQLKPFSEKYSKETLNEFFKYWTEPNKSKTKLRWEMEKTWDIGRRLSRWSSNKFGKSEEKTTYIRKELPNDYYEK